MERSERGSALLVVLVLLVWLGVIVVSNSFALNHLKRELQLIEKRQIEKAAKEWRMDPEPAVPPRAELERDSRD